MKKYFIQNNIGRAKYVVSHHDGVKLHNDKSPFFDVAIFNSKRNMEAFTTKLKAAGYVEI